MSRPAKRIVPAAGSSSRTSVRPSVDLAGAGFADDAEHAAFLDVEAQAVQDFDQRPAAEAAIFRFGSGSDTEVLDAEERVGHAQRPLLLGERREAPDEGAHRDPRLGP